MSGHGDITQRSYQFLGNLPVSSRFEWMSSMWTVIAVDPPMSQASGLRLNVVPDGREPIELSPETVVRYHQVMR
jgi:hypothetical protein